MSQKKYDVAIYGATMGANYGGLVTYYALYKAIENDVEEKDLTPVDITKI